jgi:hypothetical protein
MAHEAKEALLPTVEYGLLFLPTQGMSWIIVLSNVCELFKAAKKNHNYFSPVMEKEAARILCSRSV